MFKRHSNGFTLIELMVAISVVAILLAIGLPSFQGTIRSNRVSTSTNELLAMLSLARTEAIRNTRGASMCPSVDGTACNGAWGEGWLVWSDRDANGALDDTEIVRFTRVDNRLQVTAPAAGVLRFDARGRLAGVEQNIGLRSTQCPSGDQLVRNLRVNASGQVNVTKGPCP